jgi:hypothetical protein
MEGGFVEQNFERRLDKFSLIWLSDFRGDLNVRVYDIGTMYTK